MPAVPKGGRIKIFYFTDFQQQISKAWQQKGT